MLKLIFFLLNKAFYFFAKTFSLDCHKKVPKHKQFFCTRGNNFYASYRIKSSLGFNNHLRLLTKNSLGGRSSKTQQFFSEQHFCKSQLDSKFSKRSTQFFGQKLTFHLALDQSFSVKLSRPTVHRRLGKLIGNFMSI